MWKKKDSVSVIIYLAFIIICGSIFYYFYATMNKDGSLPNNMKRTLKYDYEVPENLRVKDIVDESKLLIAHYTENSGRDMLQIYDLNTKETTDIAEGYEIKNAKIFEDGVVWTTMGNYVKVYVKYFSEDEPIKVDDGYSIDALRISVTDNFLTYAIEDRSHYEEAKDSMNVKLFDFKDRTSKTIASYDVYKKDDSVCIHGPNTNDSTVVWSAEEGNNEKICSYDIKEGTLSTLYENTDVRNGKSNNRIINRPVLKGDRLFAIDSTDGTSIAEYNKETKSWDKFESEGLEDYSKSEERYGIMFLDNQGPLSWVAFESQSDPSYYVYDLEQNKLVFPTGKTDLKFTVEKVKNDLIYYSAYKDHDGGCFLYKYDKQK